MVCTDTKGMLCWFWLFHTTKPELSCGTVNICFLPGCFFGLMRKLWVRELYSTCDVTFWKLLCVLYGKRSCWSPRDVGGRGSPNYYFLWFFFNFRPELFTEVLGLLQNLLVRSPHFYIYVFSAWWKTRLFTRGNDQWLLQASLQQRHPAAGNHLGMCFAVSKDGRQKLCSLTNDGWMLMVLLVRFVLRGVY